MLVEVTTEYKATVVKNELLRMLHTLPAPATPPFGTQTLSLTVGHWTPYPVFPPNHGCLHQRQMPDPGETHH